MRNTHRSALTLFEVLISLVIISIGALTVLALVSVGTRAQAKVRYQLFAGAAALSLVDALHNPIPGPVIGMNTPDWRANTVTGSQSLDLPPKPGFAAGLRNSLLFASPFQHDLERVTCLPTGIALPLPLEIARRLGSDGDEIRKVLDDGGYLYYLSPAAVRTVTKSQLLTGSLNENLNLPESRNLVFAVRGYAQQNALSVHPWERWPFYQVYPFPPQSIPVRTGAGDVPGVQIYNGNNADNQLHLNAIIGGMNFGHGYHGRNWAYFRWEEQKYGPLGPWSLGWDAFQRLAGDADRTGNKYNRYTTIATPTGLLPDKLRGGYFPIQAMLRQDVFPTLAQRLNYLDRAMFLWNTLRPAGIPNLACTDIDFPTSPPPPAAVLPDRTPPDGIQIEHVYKKADYATYFDSTAASDGAKRAAMIDPKSLPADQFPPHPAQVLALSYLAHAAILVASYRAPYDDRCFDIKDGIPCHPDNTNHPQFPPAIPGPPKWPVIGVSLADWPTDAAALATFMKGYRDFARQVHEMSIRWAIAYARECPGDWGAPRPANSPVAIDQPLALFDLFYDASNATASGASGESGVAFRTAKNFRRFGGWGASESFYRWIDPPNPVRWNNGSLQAITHLGPNGTQPVFIVQSSLLNTPEFWASRTHSRQLRSPGPSPQGSSYATADAERFWLHRPFEATARGRELVFWAVNWQGYEDAESVPSAPLDIAQYGRLVNPVSKNQSLGDINAGTSSDTGDLMQMRFPSFLGGPPWDASDSRTRSLSESMLGHPERPLMWTDATRSTTVSYPNASSGANPGLDAFAGNLNSHDKDADTVLGHWGADRNGDRSFTRGPIKSSVRLRAQLVGRFTFYDPILRVAVAQ